MPDSNLPLLLVLVDPWVQTLFVLVAVWILLSGIDDLFIDLICLLTWLSQRVLFNRDERAAEERAALSAPQKRIAILVPLWKEDGVIRQMVSNNAAKIQYLTYDFFLGAYPNDPLTLSAIRELEASFSNVHCAVCANDGPTSKADCLNWIYQRLLQYERERHVRFEVIVTHDAEDVIHPHALHWINYYADTHDMIQVPVLPLATPIRRWTHGIYCDEFAEFQMKDMPGRQILGGFIPSNGVGTGFTRWALDQLAAHHGRIFEPECLTEDYENGLKLHFLGCPQIFMPVQMTGGQPMATREYFPQTRQAAIKQRTRWVTGIALQSWERHGWKGGVGTKYWMWRDRKGLIGNPVSMLTSVVFLYGLGTWLLSRYTGATWGMGRLAESASVLWLLGFTSSLQFVHLGVRAWCTSRVYGWPFAAAAPLRAVYANYINFRATMGAIWRYFYARVTGGTLVWLKTDHSYPVLAAASQQRRIGEILLSAGRITHAQLEWALRNKPATLRLGEFLVRNHLLTEEQLYQALSLQASIPFFRLDPRRVRRTVARALPAQLVQSWKVLPFQVAGGYLFLAAAEVPDQQFESDLARFTRLRVRVQLVTSTNFEELRQALL